MQAQGHNVIVLPAMCDGAGTAAFVDQARKAPHGTPIAIDASFVQLAGYSCVQSMLSMMRSRDLRVVAASDAFLSAFEEAALLAPHVSPLPAEEAAPAPEAISDAADAGNVAASTEGPVRVLTIDDSKTMRDMLRITLAEAGFEVIQAVDGQDGLDVFSGSSVDVVITDINMPRMDGYEVVRRLRDDPANKALPILVLTTESDPDKRDVGRAAGATGWLVKPFDPEKLVATVRKVAHPAMQA
jgi:two-component system chemotaxis response regulator CheY